MKHSYFLKTNPVVKGFSIIEILVAVFIFSLIMVAVAQIFSSTMLSYNQGRTTQQNLEDTEVAMNTMAKVLRTSHVFNDNPNVIRAYDYSRNICVRYRLNVNGNNQLLVSTVNNGGTVKDPQCDFLAAPETSMINAKVSGQFDVVLSKDTLTSSNPTVGKVTMSLVVDPGTSWEQTLQTSVSLRDYAFIGL